MTFQILTANILRFKRKLFNIYAVFSVFCALVIVKDFTDTYIPFLIRFIG